jgi:hypothetical protein
MSLEPRLKLFVKGNVDVHDSLHSCRIDGRVVWNGVNEVVRPRYPGVTLRLRHEISTGFRAILEADGITPDEVAERAHLQGAYWNLGQYSNAIFAAEADAIVLSIQADVQAPSFRHRRDGYLFCADDLARWPDDHKRWLAEAFEPVGPPDVAKSMDAFEQLYRRLRRHSDAPVLVFNMSSVVPGERLHCFQGLEGILSTQIRRYNLALIDLSEALGISVIDVDGVLARAGAERLQVDPVHLTAEGYRLVAEDVVRVLADLGLLPEDSGF